MKITVTLNASDSNFVQGIARRDGVKAEAAARRLIKMGMDQEEDMYFGKIAEDRVKKGGGYISSAEFWKKVQ